MVSEVFKSFQPKGLSSSVLFLLILLFAALGTWQATRAVEKEATENQHMNAGTLSLSEAITKNSRFSRIEASGHYDASRHILLDNQVWRGRAGVYVFTPFHTNAGPTILVNRGWLPLPPDRATMPEILTPQQEIVLKGMLNIVPVPGRVLGAADQLQQDVWPQLVTYLNLADISDSLETPLQTWIIQLSKSEQTGFDGRDWKPVFLSSSRHKGYAFQWFALALTGFVMWVFISFRKPSGNRQ